jgi:NADPH-dependent 2,4-dienoyl-CoA reductase/sulfur reductase-like enzyme
MKATFDIAIVGAGPAGLAAALAAAQSGMRIAIVDDNPQAGGQVWRQGPGIVPPAPMRATLSELVRNPNVVHYAGASVAALSASNEMMVTSSLYGGVSISFERLVLATGARERLLPFKGWTLPGVTGAGALQALVKGGMPVRGERVVLAGSGPLLMASLATARKAGARIVAIVEQAPWRSLLRFGLSLGLTPSKAIQAIQLTRGFAGTAYWPGAVVSAALGDARVEGAIVRRGEREVTLDCDRIACGYGLTPNVSLAQALGCALDQDSIAIAIDENQRTSIADIWAAGECTGIGGMELARAEGSIAGLAATGQSIPGRLIRERDRWRRFAIRVASAFELGGHACATPSAETIFCRCEDVPFGEVSRYESWRDAKLHTRCGMGPCQGRVCGAAAHTYFGWTAGAPRPPLVPTRIGALIEAGQNVPFPTQPEHGARL